MAQITYTNKVALNENPEIAAINKVTDDDMNEIKSVVNDNYNNTIQITSTQPIDSDNKIWIDTGEIGSQASEITNEYSTSTGKGYSANYVNNNFQSKILSTEITGTTSANGNITTGLSIANNVVLSVYVSNQTDAIPNIYSTGLQWYVHITNSQNTNIASTSVVMQVYYIEI